VARRPRIDLPGYHHVINRGVNRSDVFVSDADKGTFISILCKACRIYDVVVHDYCLMDNHYHLLIENRHENLSLFMRQINANYAIFFNKKYNRTGHLWQGRYRSWYILDEDYLFRTIRYIEYNPIEAGMAVQIRDYPYTLGSTLLRKQTPPACTKESLLIQRYSPRTLVDFLDEPVSTEEMEALETWHKKPIDLSNGNTPVHSEKKPIESYFDPSMDKARRNQAIYEAYRDGHTQRSISKFIGLTDAAVSIIIKKFKI
jgi:REP element-mobilizing transposase RayT